MTFPGLLSNVAHFNRSEPASGSPGTSAGRATTWEGDKKPCHSWHLTRAMWTWLLRRNARLELRSPEARGRDRTLGKTYLDIAYHSQFARVESRRGTEFDKHQFVRKRGIPATHRHADNGLSISFGCPDGAIRSTAGLRHVTTGFLCDREIGRGVRDIGSRIAAIVSIAMKRRPCDPS